MNSNRECAEYFRNQKVYDRCFQELWKKWRSYGRVAGKITLKETSEQERRAITGIIGKVFYERKIQFSFAEFEAGLQRTRFAPVDMKQVLEEYFGKKLQTSQTEQKEKEKKKNDFLLTILDDFKQKTGENSVAAKWLETVIARKKYGNQVIIKEYRKDPQQAEHLVKNAGNALLKLKELKAMETDSPLAVFAADVSGNPHYFDRGSPGGMLLIHGICYLKNADSPENAHSWRKLLQSVRIIPDNVSSLVHAYGLHLMTKDGLHPAYEAFCERKEPYVITMENMRGILGIQAEEKVYIVENEMVFTYLLSHLCDQSATVLCTSGQPRSVALLLISMILKGKAEIYYSGDIDPDRIRIADKLWKKFGDGIHIWRMSPQDYEKSCSMEKIGDSGISKLENISHRQLKLTAEAVKIKRLAGYQENILQELLRDIKGEV